MSAKVDHFCDTLRDRLNAIEDRVETFKTRVEALPAKAESDVRKARDDAHRKFDARKQQAEQLRTKLKTGLDKKLTETKQVVSDWKAKREVRKLDTRAEFAEAYAADAIDFAALAIEEADEAILDAVLARMDADAAH